MQRLRIRLTEADILNAERFKVSNPVLYVLQITTGTLWRFYEGGLLLELMPPFRMILLPSKIWGNWREESAKRDGLPCELDLEFFQFPVENMSLSPFLYKEANIEKDRIKPVHQLNNGQINNEQIEEGDVRSAINLDNDPAITLLLLALEREGWSRLQVVCSQILVETVTPHRTMVLRGETLHAVHDWLKTMEPLPQEKSVSNATMCVPIELYSPFTDEPVRHMLVQLDPNR